MAAWIEWDVMGVFQLFRKLLFSAAHCSYKTMCQPVVIVTQYNPNTIRPNQTKSNHNPDISIQLKSNQSLTQSNPGPNPIQIQSNWQSADCSTHPYPVRFTLYNGICCWYIMSTCCLCTGWPNKTCRRRLTSRQTRPSCAPSSCFFCLSFSCCCFLWDLWL